MGGGFFYKHCGFFTLESCSHLCVETCGGGFLLYLLMVCLGDLSLSDFYRCLFVRSKYRYGLQLLLVKRRGAAESSMDFTISLPRFARRRVPRFARLGLASLAWGSLRSPGVLTCHESYRY